MSVLLKNLHTVFEKYRKKTVAVNTGDNFTGDGLVSFLHLNTGVVDTGDETFATATGTACLHLRLYNLKNQEINVNGNPMASHVCITFQ